MMSAGGTYISTASVEVPQALQDGEKFIRWDDDSGNGTPVTMRVDSKGFYLYWVDQNNELDILDIATIRDVRTGQYAKRPKDNKLRQIVTLGPQDTLEEKTVTVCHGSDFVNMTFVNFCCTRRDIAQLWSDGLIKLAYSLAQLNGSAIMFLQKAHTKLCLQVDKSGRIPVKNIIKLFAQNKEDRKRVEKALDVTGLPSGKVDSISVSKFQFEDFYNLYKYLTQRSEVERLFDSIVGNSKRKCMSIAQLVEFLNKTQRDPRLNEILYPYANPARAKELIQQYEPNKFNAQKGQLSLDGFLRYLMGDDNPIMAPNKLDLCDDMDQPMSHYFINSSHNTYLTGHQLTGKSSVEIYRQCLLAGCRCVELDFWNGRTEEPVIVHGYTFVPEIFAKDVLEAIAESAFKTSEYPVILSFENHCNPRQQAKIANYCREIFGDMLLDKPLDSHPLEPNMDLPPPAMLRRKIIIKNKKKHHHHHHHHHHKKPAQVGTPAANNKLTTANSVDAKAAAQQVAAAAAHEDGGVARSTANGDIGTGTGTGTGSATAGHAPPLQQIRQSSKDSTGSSDSDSSSDDESLPNTTPNPPSGNEPPPEKAQKETEAGAEISALVNYVQPIHFSSFENAEKKNRCYEMSSFDEKQATTLLKERPIEFVNYNKHQLSRVYPAGTRFDSSNFMPQLFWNAGCQLVALNFQTLDLAMQLNLGIFEYNARSGYLLKPEFMRRSDRRLDPFAESTVDGIIAGTVSITVLSGQFLTDKRANTFVEVDMYGLPADTVRKKFRTKTVRDNGMNPVYDEEPFVFKKVVLPELASIRIAAYEEGGKLIGHRVLPVIGLCPGYRHVNLRSEVGQPIALASLFLCVVVKDYVPDDLSNFAEALANPIKYQSELEKRDIQLSVLTDEADALGNADEDLSKSFVFVQVGGQKKELRPVESLATSPKHRASISAAAAMSVEVTMDRTDGGRGEDSVSIVAPSIQHQHSLDQSVSTSIRQVESSQFDVDLVLAEPLDKILDHKTVKEKRLEMEKKLESLRKKHDKEKVKIAGQKSSPLEGKKPKFAITNKLVKRLSNKSLNCLSPHSEPGVEIPACPLDLGDSSEESAGAVDAGEDLAGGSSSLDGGTQESRLRSACREYTSQYRELQEKYHEAIYSAAEKVLKTSQAGQTKQLKASLDKVTGEVMHQLQEARRNEVKNLATVHRDRDELVRMKREVASSVVERGVAERVRLKQTFERRTDELQKQHDSVRNALTEHRSKARQILDKEAESRSCVSSNGFLVLFHGPHHHGCSGSGSSAISGNNLTLNLDAGAAGGHSAISPARSHNSIAAAAEMKT
ncbi:1-phosphatidylinositol 4,5-bisphosphate phosphodiesterase classes I and II isoform X1 [Drosophila gunungcola]|uniref:1-phosphatidylinositol 4,5-bisphosphate phosphodiesterase classes I and II isoform X1 n=1 Tax=Drosophila gunungcola TaxID=103775 RepID=UPI0022E3D30C|nr:1-phosphatidylinositol 4,5-bisphosphate phosphodiesterase classes I and II isoform X1 [Drosophila gunungcola]XP_052838027.1 1-phosphatidylinositol 4,5-bisphosphate phosphodiesterase classes I and II isoform X1 [Drosophila gunungcola]